MTKDKVRHQMSEININSGMFNILNTVPGGEREPAVCNS